MNFYAHYTAYYAYYSLTPVTIMRDRADKDIGPYRGAQKSPPAPAAPEGGKTCPYRVTVASTLPALGLWTVRVKGVPGWALTT